MKKLILILIATLTLSACNQQASQNTEGTTSYTSEPHEISFDYPSDWQLGESGEIQILSPVGPPPGNNIVVTIPAESFEEYENEYKDLIASERMSIEENNPTDIENLTIKKYGQHGWVYFLIEIDGIYVGIGGEADWTEEEKKGVSTILNSLSS
jgi:hypothetical protein